MVGTNINDVSMNLTEKLFKFCHSLKVDVVTQTDSYSIDYEVNITAFVLMLAI